MSRVIWQQINKRNLTVAFICCALLMFPFLQRAEVNPDYQKGSQQFEENQFDSAIVSFTQLIAAYPDKKEGYFNRGLAYFNTAKYDEAISDFTKCVQIDSVFKEAEYMKARALQEKGSVNEAYTLYSVMNTKYTGYLDLQKRIKTYQLTVLISNNWYYMLAIMFMIIVLLTIVARTYGYRKG